jgi:peptidoglycan/LPS O-acetylase OafA/YrhL
VRYFRGIDGLKSLSILAILVFHLFGGALPGGFVGIEVFFTIAGFLTARNLLIRLNSAGHLGLKRYFSKRARRIIPAVWFMACAAVALTWVVGAADVLVGIKNQLLSVATFSYNWYDIARGADYFAATGPELFRHLWFVAVLAQFYVLAPLIVWFFWKFWKPQRAAVALFLLSFASAIAMGVLFVPGSDPTTVYFGTGTHLFGLLAGVALAFMLDGSAGVEGESGNTVDVYENHRLRYGLSALLGALALVGIVVLAFVVRQDSSAFRGGLFAVAVMTDMALVGCVTPGSWLGAILGWKPLAVLGKYSYGIYLWHWPVMTLVVYCVPQWRGPNVVYPGLVTLVLTAVVSWFSFVCIEEPVGRAGLVRSLVPEKGSGARAWTVWVAAGLAVFLAVTGCLRGIRSAPPATMTQQMLQDNARHSAFGPRGSHGKPTDLLKEVPPDPVREMPTGMQMSAVGDSVMLAAQPALSKEFPGIAVDAKESRTLFAGIGIVQDLRAHRTLREYVLVGLATNSLATPDALEELLRACGPARVLVLVNAHGQRSWIPPTNTAIAQFVDKHSDQVVLVDWNAQASAHEGELYSDGIHPQPTDGASLYASSVRAALKEWTMHH